MQMSAVCVSSVVRLFHRWFEGFIEFYKKSVKLPFHFLTSLSPRLKSPIENLTFITEEL